MEPMRVSKLLVGAITATVAVTSIGYSIAGEDPNRPNRPIPLATIAMPASDTARLQQAVCTLSASPCGEIKPAQIEVVRSPTNPKSTAVIIKLKDAEVCLGPQAECDRYLTARQRLHVRY